MIVNYGVPCKTRSKSAFSVKGKDLFESILNLYMLAVAVISQCSCIYVTELDKYQTNYDAYYGQYADNAVSGEAYDQADSASEFQQHLLKYVQQYQDKQDGLSILDDPSAVSAN